MNKTAIRNFAVWARNKLRADVSYQAGLMGVTRSGIANALPQSTGDVEFYDIGTAEPYAVRGEAISQRKSLVDIIRQKENDSNYETAFDSVIEEVAYTWFNRLIAVRFMEVNDYLPAHVRVLSSESGKQEPDIVTTPFDAELYFAEGEKQRIIQMKNDNKLDEVFRTLFIKQCRELSKILPRLFEGTHDYTELLLSVSFIDQEGVVYHLVQDIPEEDFNVEQGGQVEIIGWLYQYYNAELKDETFALLKNNVKVTKERIPSATQLFTPDWIVRYMVENSLGRLWIEGHPNDILKSGWKYYLDEAEQEESVKQELGIIKAEYAKLSPENIKVIDPCMGSGHILVYAFDVLMQIYESAGYTQRDAAKSIIEKNLFGLDIDDRAAQLAYFAVMMKARQYNRRILDGESDCNVYAIKESNGFDRAALVKMGDDLKPVAEKLVDTFVDAKEYGSILNVDLTLEDLDALDKKLDDVDRMSDYGNLFDMMYTGILCDKLSVLLKQARIMTQEYDVVVTNPPYMGGSNMSRRLSDFVKNNYPKTKSDLSTVLMEKAYSFSKRNGFVSMINIPVWMFLSSFEKMRIELIRSETLIQIIHFGRGVFGSDFGTVAFCFRKGVAKKYKGNYMKLYSRQGMVESLEIKEKKYLLRDNIYQRNQEIFADLPGSQIAYWIPQKLLDTFNDTAGRIEFFTRSGLTTGDNERFLKIWWEIDREHLYFYRQENYEPCWYPHLKGGEFRKWYGDYDYVIHYDKGSIESMKRCPGFRHDGKEYFFKKSVTWSKTTAGPISARINYDNTTFNTAGCCLFSEDNEEYILGILNSSVATMAFSFLCPSLSYAPGDVAKMPIIDVMDKSRAINMVNESINISKEDWDSFETSWDFKKHPLI